MILYGFNFQLVFVKMAPTDTSIPDQPPAETTPATKETSREQLWKRVIKFAKELANDHDFWVHTIALKGGASTIVMAGVIGISYVVSLPFIVGAIGLAACCGGIGLGLYGIAVAAHTTFDKLRDLYAEIIKGEEPKVKAPIKPWADRLAENPRIQRLMQKPLAQKFLNSRTWKMTYRLTREPQELLLTALALKGSIFWGALSATVLATNIVILPVVAVGSLVTLTTVLAAGSVLSSIYGVYLSTSSLVRHMKQKKTIEKENKGSTADNTLVSDLNLPVLAQDASTNAANPLTDAFMRTQTPEAPETLTPAPASAAKRSPQPRKPSR